MSPDPSWWTPRKKFWHSVEGDCPSEEQVSPDTLIVHADRLRQRAGRVCIWAAVVIGIAWAVVLAPHCWHLIKFPEWGDAKVAWLVVSAPPVALIAALLAMAERFLTPAHLLHGARKSPEEAANAFGNAMGAGGEVAQKGLETLIENSLPGK